MAVRITRSPDIMGGVYCVDGIRMPVWTIKRCWAGGWRYADFAKNYPTLTIEQIDAALAFRPSRKAKATGKQEG